MKKGLLLLLAALMLAVMLTACAATQPYDGYSNVSTTRKMYDTWSKDAALPMFNRATDGTYAPGYNGYTGYNGYNGYTGSNGYNNYANGQTGMGTSASGRTAAGSTTGSAAR